MDLISKLKSAQVVKFGDFILKSGQKSSVYFDFRRIISYPRLFADISYRLAMMIKCKDVVITGVPMGAIPYACSIANILNLPMIMIRDSKKTYGLQNMIEGDNFGKDIVLIEDIITTGQSVINAVKILEENNKKIRKIIVILDRDGAIDKIRDMGYEVELLFKMSDFLTPLSSFNEPIINNKITEGLININRNKRTNLIVSLDLNNPDDVLKTIEIVGEHVCAIKLHLDIMKITDKTLFSDNLIKLKNKYNFLIIEDRKFQDIPHISGLQLDMLPDFIDIVTTHCISGSN